jgi:hypothetical protein
VPKIGIVSSAHVIKLHILRSRGLREDRGLYFEGKECMSRDVQICLPLHGKHNFEGELEAGESGSLAWANEDSAKIHQDSTSCISFS